MKALVLYIAIFNASISFSQIIDSFSIRFQANQRGGIKMLSNVSVGCACPSHDELPPTSASDNNWEISNFVDIDSDALTFMSSSDKLDLSDCSEISWAGLYWVGKLSSTPSLTANYTIRDQVKVSIDGGVYLNLTADEIYDNTVGKNTYFAFKDITSIVQANNVNSNYTVANVVTDTGVVDLFGGWTIIVVYKNVYETMRNLTVYDGLANVKVGSSSILNIPLSGFFTPPTGPVSFELGVVAHDGDRAQPGDQLEFNGTGTFLNMGDPIHPINNVFNSTISNGGILTPWRNPNYNNTFGHDANIYIPDNSTLNFIGNATTSATIRISTNSETFLTSVITSSIDIYEPDLYASVTYQDLNGGTVLPGDILEYTLVAKNIGSDVSTNNYLIDTLDQRLMYLPGTMEIAYGPNTGIKTDNVDLDQAEFSITDNVIQVRIGTGANETTGGLLLNSQNGSDSTVFKFRVQLIDDCAIWLCGDSLENKVHLFGVGQISGNENNNHGLSYNLNGSDCPLLETGKVDVDLSACASLEFEYTDSICVGDSILFNFNNSQYLDYQWTGPNSFTSTSSNPFISNAQLIDSGFYSLQVNYSGENCFTITDAHVFVSDNPIIQLNDIINVSCFNSNTGLIDISVISTSGVTYQWSNNDQDSVAENLTAGIYTVIVSNQYSCTVSDTFNITEPPEITLTENSINPSCQAGTQGAIDLIVNGGVPSYSYSWNNNSSSQDITGLYAGLYEVLVTDNNGCQDSLIIQLVDPDALILSENHTDVLCYGDSTGVIEVSTSNGTPNYSYSWSDGQNTQNAINLPYGNYFVNVTDQNNCGAFISVFIDQPDTLIFVTNSSHTNVLCFGEMNGQIDLNIDGGITPYSYLWSNGDTTLSLTNLPADNYTLNVTDANGCVFVYLDSIIQPDSLYTSETHGDVLCLGDSNGFIEISTVGGVSPYMYSWNTGTNSEDILGVPVGTYELTVVDSNNCLSSIQVVIESELSKDECVKMEMPNVFTPNNDLINDTFTPVEIKNVQSVSIVVLNRWGQTVFESDKLNFGWDGIWKDRECIEGVYFYIIEFTDNYLRTFTINGNVSLVR